MQSMRSQYITAGRGARSQPRPLIPCARIRAGFTLVELVLAAAVAAIILVSLQSVVLLASKALPDTSKTTTPADALMALSRLTSDLRYATMLSEASATAVTIQVPDRDGDGKEDTITYSWSGKDSPFTRVFNESEPELLCAGVRSLSLAYDTWSDQRPQTYTQSAELLLASWTGTSNQGQSLITSSDRAGQYVPVVLAAGAVSYRPTAVSLMAALNGTANGTTSVEFRAAVSGLPTSTIFASATLLESTLTSTLAWTRIDIPGCRQLDAAEKVCIVAQWLSNSTSCQIQYQGSGVPTANGAIVTTTNGGSTWSTTSGRSLQYRLYGTVTTADPPVYFDRCTCVRLTLQGQSPAHALPATIPLANQPEVAK